MTTIRIEVDLISLEAELTKSPTATKILDALPLEGQASVWGEEIYFEIPLRLELEPDAREVVSVGDLGYWSVGAAFCIFFGRTPVSTDEQPKAYSPVNVFGRLTGDPDGLKAVQEGARIVVTKI